MNRTAMVTKVIDSPIIQAAWLIFIFGWQVRVAFWTNDIM